MPLTELEHEIVKTVVERFVRLKESTPRKLLIIRFRSPDTLYRLSSAAILRNFNRADQEFLPSALAFHYSGDPDFIRMARTSVEIVLHVLQNMFDVEMEKIDFTPADVEAHAHRMYDVVYPDNIKLGLYLAQDFGALGGWSTNPEQTELATLRIAENIVTIKNISNEWDAYVERNTSFDKPPDRITDMERLLTGNESSSGTRPTTHSGLLVFISHSSKDADLALALIDLLKAGLALTADQIRCSSVDGYRLPVGVNTEGKLREEVNAAKVVVGLITPSSLSSYYVMFELGARWGANLFLAPLLAGVKASQLSGPLSLLNALSASSDAQLHQLLGDIANHLGLSLQPAASYIRNVTAVKTLAEAITNPTTAQSAATAVKQKLKMTLSAEGTPPSQFLKVVANRHVKVSRVEYMLSSEASMAGEDVSLDGATIEIPINDGSVLKLWNTPRPDRNNYDRSGPAKIAVTVSVDEETDQYILPVQMEFMTQNNTAYRKLVGSKTFYG